MFSLISLLKLSISTDATRSLTTKVIFSKASIFNHFVLILNSNISSPNVKFIDAKSYVAKNSKGINITKTFTFAAIWLLTSHETLKLNKSKMRSAHIIINVFKNKND